MIKYLKLMAVALVLVGIIVFLDHDAVIEEVSPQMEHYKKLEKENEVLSLKNDSLSRSLTLLNKSSDSLKQVIHQNDTLLEEIQQKKDEEINNIQGFSDVELFEFFSEFNSKSRADSE